MTRLEVDTWYVLADGTKAHPADVAADEAGVLKHSNGVPVALRANGLPLTTGDANKENAMAADLGKEAEAKAKAEAEARAKADAEAKRLADEAAAAKAKGGKPKAAKPGDTPAEADREIKAGEGTKTYETR